MGKDFIDISSPLVKAIGGAKHWLLCLDDYSVKCFCFFLSHKDLLKTRLVPFIEKLDSKFGIRVRIIRCDKAGENIETQ